MECRFYWFVGASTSLPWPRLAPIWADHWRKENSAAIASNVLGTVLDLRWRMGECSMGLRSILNLAWRCEYATDKSKSAGSPILPLRKRRATSRILHLPRNEARRLKIKLVQQADRR